MNAVAAEAVAGKLPFGVAAWNVQLLRPRSRDSGRAGGSGSRYRKRPASAGACGPAQRPSVSEQRILLPVSASHRAARRNHAALGALSHRRGRVGRRSTASPPSRTRRPARPRRATCCPAHANALLSQHTLQFEKLDLEVAQCTAAGMLALLVLRPTTRLRLFGLAGRGALKGLRGADNLRCYCASRIEVYWRASRTRIKVAVDGECIECNLPLRAEVARNALAVLVPREPEPRA